jgi:DNA adenine methylase
MELKEKKVKPLLRWAGGKFWMIDRINDLIPKSFNNYREPFVGGGSVFLNIKREKKSFISDCNPELIAFYKQVQNNLDDFLSHLKKFKNEESYFYKIRSKSESTDEIEIAARFYFLNRTCFNGLYRVNQNGYFNVPYGYRDVDVIDNKNFVLLNKRLQKINIQCCDFADNLKSVKKGDFVFLDPPYTVAHNLNGFIAYNQKIFTWQDQERLAECVNQIIARQAFFIMTNACHDSIKNYMMV